MFKKRKYKLMKMNRKARSQICNMIYWSKNISDFKSTLEEKKSLKYSIKRVEHVNNYINNFTWRREDVDWDPWVITVIHNGLTDDCDGAAVLGKYLFKLIGKDADVFHLIGKESGHAVTITKDRDYMISNSNLYKIKDNWMRDVYNYFNGRYRHVIKYKG